MLFGQMTLSFIKNISYASHPRVKTFKHKREWRKKNMPWHISFWLSIASNFPITIDFSVSNILAWYGVETIANKEKVLCVATHEKQKWKIKVIITKQPIQPEISTTSMSLVWFGFHFLFFSPLFAFIHKAIISSGLFFEFVCCNNADCSHVCVCLNFHRKKMQWRKKRTNKSGFVCIVSSALWLWCNSLGENETTPKKI